MLQTSIFFIVALVVALVLVLVIRKMNHDDGPHWAVVLLILVVAGNVAWFGDAWAKDRAVQAKTAGMIRIMEEDENIAAMKATAPNSFDRMVKAVKDSEEAPEDERLERVQTLMKPVIDEFVKDKLLNMNDEVAIKFGTMIGDAMIARGRTNPSDCISGMSNIKSGENFEQLLGAERAKEFRRDFLFGQTIPNAPAMEASRSKMMLVMSLPVAAAQAGITIDPATKPSQGDLCVIMGTSVKSFTKELPKAEGASFVRAFVRGGAAMN